VKKECLSVHTHGWHRDLSYLFLTSARCMHALGHFLHVPLLLGSNDEGLLLLWLLLRVLGCEVGCQAVLPHHCLAPSWALQQVVVACCPVLLAWLAAELAVSSTALWLAWLPVGCEVGAASCASTKATCIAAHMLLEDVRAHVLTHAAGFDTGAAHEALLLAAGLSI